MHGFCLRRGQFSQTAWCLRGWALGPERLRLMLALQLYGWHFGKAAALSVPQFLAAGRPGALPASQASGEEKMSNAQKAAEQSPARSRHPTDANHPLLDPRRGCRDSTDEAERKREASRSASPPQHGVQGPHLQHPPRCTSGLCLDVVCDTQGVGMGVLWPGSFHLEFWPLKPNHLQ